MPDWVEIDLKQYYEDWRHRDRLTWQIPTVVIAVGGMLIATAYGYQLEPMIRSLMFWPGAFFAGTMTTMLAQNLYYQWRDAEHISNLSPRNKPVSRPIPPSVGKEGDWRWKHPCGTIIGFSTLGSTLLLICCLSVFGTLCYLFISECWKWCHVATKVGSIAIFVLSFPGLFLHWLCRDPKHEIPAPIRSLRWLRNRLKNEKGRNIRIDK